MLPIALPLRAGVRPILRLFSDLSLFKIEHPHDEAANRGGADALCPLWRSRSRNGPGGGGVAARLLSQCPNTHSTKTSAAHNAIHSARSEEHTSELQSPDHLVC